MQKGLASKRWPELRHRRRTADGCVPGGRRHLPPHPEFPQRWMNRVGPNPRKPVVRVPPKRVAERYRPPRGSGNRVSGVGLRPPAPDNRWPPAPTLRWTKSTRQLCYQAYTAGCAQYRCPLHGSPPRGSHPVGNTPRTGRWRRYQSTTSIRRRRRAGGLRPWSQSSRPAPGSPPRGDAVNAARFL